MAWLVCALSAALYWAPSAITFARRFQRYLHDNFFEHQVRVQGHTCMSSMAIKVQVADLWARLLGNVPSPESSAQCRPGCAVIV